MSAIVQPGSPGSPATPTRLVAQWIRDWRQLGSVAASWDALEQRALEPSPSSERWMLLPAWQHLGAGEVKLLLLRDATAHAGPEEGTLRAVVPLQTITRYTGLPITAERIWNHPYSLFAAPLLDRDVAHDCVRELLASCPATLVEFPELRSDSAFFRVLCDVIREDDMLSLAENDTRAFFRPRPSVDEYLDSISTPKHRHEMRRQERRLSELGTLEYDALEPGGNVVAWLDEFVALEMSGWKGKDGTAFGCNPEHLAYLNKVVMSAAQRGQLMLLALRLEGRAIAMKLNFLAWPGGFAAKIAYDESYFKYSPGTLLELENIKRLHADPRVQWMDSLAVPTHPLKNRVWLDRTCVVHLTVAPRNARSEFWMSLLPILRWAKRRFHRRQHQRSAPR